MKKNERMEKKVELLVTGIRTIELSKEEFPKGQRKCTVILKLCTELQCTVLYCTVLYCTALHCTVLNCTVFGAEYRNVR